MWMFVLGMMFGSIVSFAIFAVISVGKDDEND